jgi:hypothetical protein
MPLVSADLDVIQRYLRDSGQIWNRTELLRWYTQGYRALLAESHGVKQLTVLNVPPRHSYSITYEWEKRYVQGGTARRWTYTGPTGAYQCTALWEVEQFGPVAPTTQHATVTHLFELAYAREPIDTPYRFSLPKNHERIAAAWYDHEPLEPVAMRDLDGLETAWTRQQGEPLWWTPGGGETRSFELYEVVTTYQADYEFHQQEFHGFPRRIAGDRTYTACGAPLENGYAYTTHGDSLHRQATSHFPLPGVGQRVTQDVTATYQGTYIWERERQAGATTLTESGTIGTASWEAAYGATNFRDAPTGLLRVTTSPERQYLPMASWQAPLGGMRDLRSSVGNVLLWEVVLPDVPLLAEDDTPSMIPPPLQKYLRYYVLYCCFARQGEGYRVDLAAHYKARWDRGPKLLRKLSDVTFADVQYRRQTGRTVDGPRRVSPYAPLPSTYPRVRV